MLDGFVLLLYPTVLAYVFRLRYYNPIAFRTRKTQQSTAVVNKMKPDDYV